MYKTTCLENQKLWNFIYQYETINKKKLVLTPEQRFELCRFINGKIFDKKVLQSIFQKN
jgi:hypothetical protein